MPREIVCNFGNLKIIAAAQNVLKEIGDDLFVAAETLSTQIRQVFRYVILCIGQF